MNTKYKKKYVFFSLNEMKNKLIKPLVVEKRLFKRLIKISNIIYYNSLLSECSAYM